MLVPTLRALTTLARLVLAGLLIVAATGSSEVAAEPCFREDSPPDRALTGRLRRIRVSVPDLPEIDGQTYFVLDLPRPICLDRGADGRTENVRSVHVFALDSAGRRQLRRYAERRVTITFRQVFGELTAHHLRPIVGEVARTALAR